MTVFRLCRVLLIALAGAAMAACTVDTAQMNPFSSAASPPGPEANTAETRTAPPPAAVAAQPAAAARAQRAAAPPPAADAPDPGPLTIQKAREFCWMKFEQAGQRVNDLDKRLKLVEKCVDERMAGKG